MEEIVIAKAALNPPVLDAELRAALGSLVSGISAARGEVRVHFTRCPDAADIVQVRRVVELHDAQTRSADQRAAEARQAQLAILRRAVDAFDLSAPLASDALDVAVRWLLMQALNHQPTEV